MADELKRGYLRPRFVEGYDPAIDRMSDRIDELEAEVERLRAALALAIGELSTYGPMRYTSPDQLMEHFMEEARRD